MSSQLDVAYFPLGAAAFGGAERSLLELASAQRAAGRRVAVFYEAALASTDFVTQAQAANVPVVPVRWAPEQPLHMVANEVWRFFGGLDARLLHFNISWRSNMWLVPLIARWRSEARLVGSMRAMPDRYELVPRTLHFGVIPGLRLWKLPDLAVGRVWARALHATVSVNRDDYPPRLISEFGFAANRLSVIYNGVRPWTVPRSLAELIPVPVSWKRYVPELEVPILDVSRMPDSDMLGEDILHITLVLLKYGRDPSLPEVLKQLFRSVADRFQGQRAATLLDTIRKYVMSVNPVVGENEIQGIFSEFWPVKPEPGSVADQLLSKGRQEGRQEGQKEGEIKLIRTLESILGVSGETTDLSDKSLETLQQITESLQERIKQRGI